MTVTSGASASLASGCERCVTASCPSFIIRPVFMEQAGKLNIAAQCSHSQRREQKAPHVVVVDNGNSC